MFTRFTFAVPSSGFTFQGIVSKRFFSRFADKKHRSFVFPNRQTNRLKKERKKRNGQKDRQTDMTATSPPPVKEGLVSQIASRFQQRQQQQVNNDKVKIKS
jgi:hypothetical protein